MNIIEIIKKRRSCRTFNPDSLIPADKDELNKFISENNKGLDNEVVNFKIIERTDSENQLKINYGMIQGHKAFVLGTSKSNPNSRLNYGYLMEKVVLKATELNMATCWVGYFDQSYFKEIIPEEGFEIPSILIIGYAEEKQSVSERLVRYTIKAHKRNSWDDLFFNFSSKLPLSLEQVSKYADSLEMVRLGPSSGNTQPWRIYFDDSTNEFHFFKKTVNKNYEEMGLHDIDMGIALAHFELTTVNNGLSGTWFKHTQQLANPMDDLSYIMTWKCK